MLPRLSVAATVWVESLERDKTGDTMGVALWQEGDTLTVRAVPGEKS